jgi:hypothetical protein
VKLKRWASIVLTGVSAVACLTTMILWGESYQWQRTFRHERVLEEGPTWKVRIAAVTSAAGSIEISAATAHVYMIGTAKPGGFTTFSAGEMSLAQPALYQSGWQKSFAGFGIEGSVSAADADGAA